MRKTVLFSILISCAIFCQSQDFGREPILYKNESVSVYTLSKKKCYDFTEFIDFMERHGWDKEDWKEASDDMYDNIFKNLTYYKENYAYYTRWVIEMELKTDIIWRAIGPRIIYYNGDKVYYHYGPSIYEEVDKLY